MNNTTPMEITETIRSFCREIDPSQEPLFIRVEPKTNCRLNFCMTDVPRYQAQFGGAVQYGWRIWEAPGLLLEAEFHAAWRSPPGTLIDIIPAPDGEKTVLFLSDSRRVYEHQLVDNIRKPLTDSSEIKDIIASAKFLYEIKKKHFRNDGVDMAAVERELDQMRAKRDRAGFPKVGRNELCPCGSMRKYKKCCGTHNVA